MSLSEDVISYWNKKGSNTGIENFMKIINQKYSIKLQSYWELHEWSINNIGQFWEEVWLYFEIVASKPFDEVFVKTGPGFVDVDWFPGSRFNYAENLLRIRDDSVALYCADEEGNFETVTWAEMFDEVKLFAAAFRKNGLRAGDRVACYMPNIKEAIYAFLATTSIGAIWGGPQPYCGAKAAAQKVVLMEPTFLITVDRHKYEAQINMLEKLPVILENSPTLKKVIIVPTQKETLSKDLSHILNSCLLEEFLNSGRSPDGTVPDMIFDQFPASHPVSIVFTSGTTGTPKGIVHSASTLLAEMLDIGLHSNLQCGDVAFAGYANGWTLWNRFVSYLSIGVKLFLYCGSYCHSDMKPNFWDIIQQYKINFLHLVPAFVDRMEKMELKPNSDVKFEHLKVLKIGGSPVTKHNINYIRRIVGKNVVVTSGYGTSESMVYLNGHDLNLPLYFNELQVPPLGMNVQCFDENGQPVIGQRGEVVITTPYPAMPTGLWKDKDNIILNSTYLSKYTGVWCQHDTAVVNPETRGMTVLGRSDDTITQNGGRFVAAEIYFAIHDLEEIADYICVGQIGKENEMRAVLFIKMKSGFSFNSEIKQKIEDKIEAELWKYDIPEVIREVKDIPYNLNNKRMESVVRKIVTTNRIPEVDNIRNPESLKYFCDIPEILSYNV